MNPSRRPFFLKEVRMLMYGFGDVRAPRFDTAEALHAYLIDYLSILLTSAHNMAQLKGKTKTEDLLYFLKRDRLKYTRVKGLLIANEELKVARKIFRKDEYENDE